MKISKQAFNKLNQSKINVELHNGCFNVATVKAEFSKYTLELRVEVTHHELYWQCGNRDKFYLVLWQGHTGTHIDVPIELYPLVEKIIKAATMTDEEAIETSKKTKALFQQAMAEIGL